jgi:hypothetical protein
MIRSQRMRFAENIAHMESINNAYKIVARKCDENRPLGRPRCQWIT